MNVTLKEKTAKGFFWAALGNGSQQVVMMLIGIVMARLLEVADYGAVAMLTVFSTVAAHLKESGFTSALCVKKEAKDEDYNAVFWLVILVSVGLYALLFLCAPLIAAFNATPQLTSLGRVMFLGFVISGIGTAQAAYIFRNLMVHEKTVAQVSSSLLSGAVGIVSALCEAGCWSLVAMDLSYKFSYTCFVWHYCPWRPDLRVNLRPAFRMWGFGCRLLATNVLTTLNGQLLQSIMGHYYPARQVGYYSQANKWSTMGSLLLVGMVGNVAQPVLAGVNDETDRQVRIFRKMLRFTAMLSFPALGALGLAAPEFIPLTVGVKWMVCVPYLQTLCVACAFVPVCQMFSNLLISKGQSGRYLVATLMFLVLQLACVCLLYVQGVQTLLYAIALLNVAWLPVWHAFSRHLTRMTFLSVLADLFPFLAATLLSLFMGGLAAWALPGMLVKLLVKCLVVLAVYAALMQWMRMDIWKDCVQFIVAKLRRH